MHVKSFAVMFAAWCLLLAGPAAAEEKMIVKPSPHTVSATIDRLEAVVKEKGATVFARIDHAAGAKAAGMDMKAAIVLIFGNPKLGTPLMMSDPRIGLDLPLKVLAWEDGTGKVWLGYTDPASLKARYATNGVDEVFGKITGALNAFTDAATKAQ